MMLSAVVVGAGRIGSTNDRDNPAEPLSHVGAVLRTDSLDLAAIVEASEAARQEAKAQWHETISAPILPSLNEMMSVPDIISVCTPTAQHYEVVANAAMLGPKLLIVEKPFAASTKEAEELRQLCFERNVILRVNYNRRFDPSTIAFGEALGDLPAKAILRYGKGLFNYASHMIDLMLFWFGPVHSVQTNSSAVLSGGREDPNIDFRCRMAAGFDAHFVGINGLQYDQFDVDIYFDDRCARYLDGGVRRSITVPIQDLHYRGYAHLKEVAESVSVGRVTGFQELYEAAVISLNGKGSMPGCDGLGAIAVHRVIEAVLESSRNGGREVLVDEEFEDVSPKK